MDNTPNDVFLWDFYGFFSHLNLLHFIPKGTIDNRSALVQVMA